MVCLTAVPRSLTPVQFALLSTAAATVSCCSMLAAAFLARLFCRLLKFFLAALEYCSAGSGTATASSPLWNSGVGCFHVLARRGLNFLATATCHISTCEIIIMPTMTWTEARPRPGVPLVGSWQTAGKGVTKRVSGVNNATRTPVVTTHHAPQTHLHGGSNTVI